MPSFSRDPRRDPKARSNSAVHTGIEPKTSAATPDETCFIAIDAPPSPVAIMNEPMATHDRHSRSVGAGTPLRRRKRKSTTPAEENRTAAISNGGMLATAMRVAR